MDCESIEGATLGEGWGGPADGIGLVGGAIGIVGNGMLLGLGTGARVGTGTDNGTKVGLGALDGMGSRFMMGGIKPSPLWELGTG